MVKAVVKKPKTMSKPKSKSLDKNKTKKPIKKVSKKGGAPMIIPKLKLKTLENVKKSQSPVPFEVSPRGEEYIEKSKSTDRTLKDELKNKFTTLLKYCEFSEEFDEKFNKTFNEQLSKQIENLNSVEKIENLKDEIKEMINDKNKQKCNIEKLLVLMDSRFDKITKNWKKNNE